ncbi:MAG: benzoate-CoA ligase family protein [Verrucomicrobiae bacterium]|nr:benzoate-CoA ligase family protein [Verrucomicrobiae bacterium]
MQPPYNNLAGLLYANLAAGRSGKTAVCCGDLRLTYGEMAALTSRAGNALKRAGVERGDRVALLLPDGPEFMAVFLGAAAIGAVAAPFNTNLAAAEYEYLFHHGQAKILVTGAALYPLVETVWPKCPCLKKVIVTGHRFFPQTTNWHVWMDGVSSELAVADTDANEPAFWLYSSGSAGCPKGVVHLHRSMVYSCRYYAQGVLGMDEKDVCFSAAKLYHAYGLGNSLSFPFFSGASSILWPGPPLPEVLFETINRFKPTIFFATPALYVGMLAIDGAEKKYDLSSLRLCVSAGEALPAAVFTQWKERFGGEILDGIGSTEMLHIFISNRPGHARAGSSGLLVPGYQARIIDEQGNPVPPEGGIGDLWVSGESSALEYWNNPEKTRDTMRGEWIVTGDKYSQDAEGFYWYQGRSDDMLKVNGLWVSPIELENVLNEHPDVKESAVVGLRDQNGLIQAKAFVVLRQGVAVSPDMARKLQAFVKQRMPQRYPKLFEFVAVLPRTSTGKIKRFELREAGVIG